MAATDVVFSGLYHAVGFTVSVSVCGLDCGDYAVSIFGEITVPANSDPDGNFNGGYLAQFDVGPYDKLTYGDQTTRIDLGDGVGGWETIYVPVVIGFTYPSWGMPLRPMAEDQVKSPAGPALGKTRRTHWLAALLLNTQGISFGTDGAVYDPAPLADPAGNVFPKNTLFSGVWQQPLDNDPSFNSMVAWQVTRPYACTVVSIEGFLETSER
jgi:hypothetical protein